MEFSDLINPLSMEEFIVKVNAKESIFMPGDGKRDFNKLISLADIETALNNGCNVSNPMEIIANGMRYPIIDQKLYWSPTALKKREITNFLKLGHSFMMINMSQINNAVAELIDTVEKSINHCHADLHLYISPMNDGTGYSAHRDRPQHKIYLQVIGNTSWQIFSHSDEVPEEDASITEAGEDKYLTEIMNFTMVPGDVLYMPPGQFHKVRNHSGPRVSFSIPFVIDSNYTGSRMDRSHIPFQAIFEEAQEKIKLDK